MVSTLDEFVFPGGWCIGQRSVRQALTSPVSCESWVRSKIDLQSTDPMQGEMQRRGIQSRIDQNLVERVLECLLVGYRLIQDAITNGNPIEKVRKHSAE